MKSEHILIIAVALLAFALGWLTHSKFQQCKTNTTTYANFFGVSPPDSVVAKKATVQKGKPDKVSVVQNLPHQDAPDQPGTSDSTKQIDNTPYGEDYGNTEKFSSFKTFEDDLAKYVIEVVSSCPADTIKLSVTPKTMQSVSECNPLTTFAFGATVGIIVTLVAEIVIYFLAK